MRSRRRRSSASRAAAYDVIILNFANCDMVGHTGVYEAACKAVATVDECVGRVVEATSKMGGVSSSPPTTATPSGWWTTTGDPLHRPHHQPGALLYRGRQRKLRDGRLADIAPTMLDLMGLEKPKEMDGETLIVN